MQFSDITNSIRDAWDFCWPPIVVCCIVYGVARHFDASATDVVVQDLVTTAKLTARKVDDARTWLEPFGLTKIVPLISLVLLIGFMFLLNGPLRVLVNSLPPYFSYRPDILLFNSMSAAERLRVLRKFPEARSFNEAYYLAMDESKVATLTASIVSTGTDRWHKAHFFIKVALLMALAMFLRNLHEGQPPFRELWKLLEFTIPTIVLWFVVLLALLKDQEQKFHRDWRPIKLQVHKGTDTVLTLPATDEEARMLTQDAGQRWWRAYAVDPYRFQWIRRTLFPGGPANRSKRSGR